MADAAIPSLSLERYPVSEDRRKPRLVFKRQRAKHTLQLQEADGEHERVDAARNAVYLLTEAKAKAAERRAAGMAPAGPADDVDLIDKRLAAATAALKIAERLQRTHAERVASLVLRQQRERARLSATLTSARKQQQQQQLQGAEGGAKPAGEEGAEGEDAAAAGGAGAGASSSSAAAPPAARGKSKRGRGGGAAGAASSAAAAPTAAAMTHICAYCAAAIDKSLGAPVTCSECARQFCGDGGKGVRNPSALPCLDVYRCKCGQNLCYDCMAGCMSRDAARWGHCCLCDDVMCPKDAEQAAKLPPCACGAGPFCRTCRSSHEKTCRSAGGGAADSDDDEDDSDRSSDSD